MYAAEAKVRARVVAQGLSATILVLDHGRAILEFMDSRCHAALLTRLMSRSRDVLNLATPRLIELESLVCWTMSSTYDPSTEYRQR